ncbi:uncharacterized protein BX663DRAFT_512659 [Cokeromyces recurvatus]|uniref:uncharacterized protein n=1 Tax=Cokeromyces recurvatus TaxID=90255 RepID=UPI00222043FF|nr:uncharacterized protein BX663DRAFT_512659 [Cokeromyces recurvatus]KAI7901864.1 hypothetical protein BX663DRAFT_512659 [Cokeromyces recurvatus]
MSTISCLHRYNNVNFVILTFLLLVIKCLMYMIKITQWEKQSIKVYFRTIICNDKDKEVIAKERGYNDFEHSNLFQRVKKQLLLKGFNDSGCVHKLAVHERQYMSLSGLFQT